MNRGDGDGVKRRFGLHRILSDDKLQHLIDGKFRIKFSC